MLSVAVIGFLATISIVFSPSLIDKSAESVIKLEKNNPDNRKIGDDAGSGTGFVTLSSDGKKVIISNAHVCGLNKFMYSQFKDKTYKHKVMKKSKIADLCMLTVPENMNIDALEMAENVAAEEEITAIGYPYGKFKVRTKGKFKGLVSKKALWNLPLKKCKGKEYLSIEVIGIARLKSGEVRPRYGCIATFNKVGFITAMTAPGGSGSPIVNSYGKVTGVVAMVQLAGAPWALSMSLEYLKAFLKG